MTAHYSITRPGGDKPRFFLGTYAITPLAGLGQGSHNLIRTMLSLGTQGRVEQIFIAPYSGAPMEALAGVEALEGCGLRGDRYVNRTGYWSGVDECQVTLIEAEVLERIAEDLQLPVLEGQHRRNIVTRGIRLHRLLGKQFAIGEAVFEYMGTRPPCAHLQSLSQRGTARALFGQRGGIGARVLQSGLIEVGSLIVPRPEWHSQLGVQLAAQ